MCENSHGNPPPHVGGYGPWEVVNLRPRTERLPAFLQFGDGQRGHAETEAKFVRGEQFSFALEFVERFHRGRYVPDTGSPVRAAGDHFAAVRAPLSGADPGHCE